MNEIKILANMRHTYIFDSNFTNKLNFFIIFSLIAKPSKLAVDIFKENYYHSDSTRYTFLLDLP